MAALELEDDPWRTGTGLASSAGEDEALCCSPLCSWSGDAGLSCNTGKEAAPCCLPLSNWSGDERLFCIAVEEAVPCCSPLGGLLQGRLTACGLSIKATPDTTTWWLVTLPVARLCCTTLAGLGLVAKLPTANGSSRSRWRRLQHWPVTFCAPPPRHPACCPDVRPASRGPHHRDGLSRLNWPNFVRPGLPPPKQNRAESPPCRGLRRQSRSVPTPRRSAWPGILLPRTRTTRPRCPPRKAAGWRWLC